MKEYLGYTTKSGIEISDRMVRITMIPKEYFGAKEMEEEIRVIEMNEHLDFDIHEQEEIINKFNTQCFK